MILSRQSHTKNSIFKDLIYSILMGAAILILPALLIMAAIHFYNSATAGTYNTQHIYSGCFLFSYSLLSLLITLIMHKAAQKNISATCIDVQTKSLKGRATTKTYIIYGLLTILLGAIFETTNYLLLGSDPVTPWQQELVNNNLTSSGISFLFIATVIFAPLWEELLFRGILFDCWHRYFPASVTITLTAAAWALLHYQQYSLLVLFDIFLIGLVLGHTRNKFDSFKLPVFLHMVNNLFAFAFMYIYSIAV